LTFLKILGIILFFAKERHAVERVHDDAHEV